MDENVDVREQARRRRIIAIAVVLAVLSIASVVAVSFSTSTDDPATTTSVPPENGLAPVATTVLPPEGATGAEPFAGIWPFTSQAAVDAYRADPGVGMFFDAEATALEFARVYLGMPEPVAVSGFVADGGGVSGGVALRSRARSPMVTRVQVRRFGGADGPFAVLGADTDNLRVDRPVRAQAVGRTVTVTGRSRAFEGSVDIEVRQDGQAPGEFLGRTFVLGGAGEALAPFTGLVSIEAPSAPAGALVVTTTSAEDGALQEATVVRVAFGTGGATGTGRVRFSVFFHRGEDLASFEREVEPTVAVLKSALESLLRGPTAADGPGVSSLFSERTAGLLAGVVLRPDGMAVIDLADEVPNASASAASRALLEELDATVFQFPTVSSVEYRLRGSCTGFWTWLQMGECRVVERPSD